MSAFWRWLKRYKSVFGLAIAGLLLLMAQSAFWINQTIFDKQTFTSITSSVLQSEESRQAVATTVVDSALEQRPLLKRTISNQATQLITGLLGTDLAQQATSEVINRTYTYLTSESPEPIAIDLLAIKTPLAGLISFAEQRGREVTFDPATIPDSIEIFNPENLPDIHRYSSLMLIIGPLCWIGAFTLFSLYIYRGRRAYNVRVYIVGIVALVVAGIGLMVGPLLTPTVVSQVPVVELREVVEDLLQALLRPFVQQMLWLIVITLVSLAIFNQRFAIFNLVQKLVHRPEKHQEVKTAPKPSTKKRVKKVK